MCTKPRRHATSQIGHHGQRATTSWQLPRRARAVDGLSTGHGLVERVPGSQQAHTQPVIVGVHAEISERLYLDLQGGGCRSTRVR